MKLRRKPDPMTHNCKRWEIISPITDTYIEQCVGCGRQRARIAHH